MFAPVLHIDEPLADVWPDRSKPLTIAAPDGRAVVLLATLPQSPKALRVARPPRSRRRVPG